MSNKYWTDKTDEVDEIVAKDFNDAFDGLAKDIESGTKGLTSHKAAEVLDHPDGSVTTEKIADGAVTYDKLDDTTVKSYLTAAEAHAADTLNPHGVTKEQVGLGNLLNVEQAQKTEFNIHRQFLILDHPDGCITSQKLSDLCVSSRSIANNAVKTEKIADGAVTTNKLSNDITSELNKISQLENSVNELQGDLDAVNITKSIGKNILNIDDIEVGNFSSSGGLIDSTNYSRTRNMIPVVEGETYTLQSGTNIPVKIKMRYVFAYNYVGEIVDSNQFVETYTVPIGQGVAGIKISIESKYANESAGTMLSKGTEVIQYEPYREIEYVDCGIKLKNAIDYDIIVDMEKDLKRSHYDFRYMDTVCSEYSCASPYIANPGHQSVNVVYDMYDELMSKYPDYISKTLIGTIDDYGYEVYRYDFTPPVPISSTESDVCKILYCTGTHGEYPSIWVGIRFLRDLCDNWRSDKMLQSIRFGCHITAIPLVNPYGFVNNSRKNENGIDINRNFTNDWIFKTDDVNSVEYQGLSPASEKSTQIIEALCAGERFDFGIDHHIYGSFDGSGMLGYFVNCLKKPENVSFGNMYGLWANQKCMAENTLISDFSKSYFKTSTNYSFDGYLYGAFENGILWESMTGWGNAEMENVVESQKFNVECLAALIYSAMKHYRRY